MVGLCRSARAISDCTRARELVFGLFWPFGHWRRASVMLAMDNNLTPFQPEGSRTFWMATWNIIDGRRGRLSQAAAGLAQMRVGLVVLTETKLVGDRHPKTASGYAIMCTKVVSGHQGGVALMWKEDDPKFEVESVLFNNPEYRDLSVGHRGRTILRHRNLHPPGLQ